MITANLRSIDKIYLNSFPARPRTPAAAAGIVHRWTNDGAACGTVADGYLASDDPALVTCGACHAATRRAADEN